MVLLVYNHSFIHAHYMWKNYGLKNVLFPFSLPDLGRGLNCSGHVQYHSDEGHILEGHSGMDEVAVILCCCFQVWNAF